MSAEKGPKHIYAEEHQLYYYYYNFEEHLVQKQEHFATSETRMTRWLTPAGSNMLEPAKMFIRARIIRHNARQSYNNFIFLHDKKLRERFLPDFFKFPGTIPTRTHKHP